MNRLAPRTKTEWQGFREAVAIVGLALLLVALLEVGLEWREMTRATDWRTAGGSAPTLAAPSISLSPVVEVRAVLELPTATPTTVPTVRPTTAPTKAPDWCLPGVTTPGDICQKAPPTPPPPTAFPACDEERVRPRDWCVWAGVPTPHPTVAACLSAIDAKQATPDAIATVMACTDHFGTPEGE